MLPRLPRTQRQKEVFDYLVSFLERRGYIPTYTQIAKHLGVKSRATVAKHIKALERLGLISIQDEPFAITIIKPECRRLIFAKLESKDALPRANR